ncbi:hypothetical protein BH10CYA1_BH10CYA1_18040 [soil metagenome]
MITRIEQLRQALEERAILDQLTEKEANTLRCICEFPNNQTAALLAMKEARGGQLSSKEAVLLMRFRIEKTMQERREARINLEHQSVEAPIIDIQEPKSTGVDGGSTRPLQWPKHLQYETHHGSHHFQSMAPMLHTDEHEWMHSMKWLDDEAEDLPPGMPLPKLSDLPSFWNKINQIAEDMFDTIKQDDDSDWTDDNEEILSELASQNDGRSADYLVRNMMAKDPNSEGQTPEEYASAFGAKIFPGNSHAASLVAKNVLGTITPIEAGILSGYHNFYSHDDF